MPVVVSVPLTVKVKGFVVEGDSPERVKVLVVGMVGCPRAIVEGLKEHVAPPAQERAMVSVKFAGAERPIVKGVAVIPIRRRCESVGELRLKTGFPTPVKGTLDVPLATLSVMLRDPVRVPVAVGVKVTLKTHCAPTASVKGVTEQLVVSAKSPVTAMAVIVNGTPLVPLLVIVTCSAALVVFIICWGNTSLGGVNSTVVY
jgi:hypothetical protein